MGVKQAAPRGKGFRPLKDIAYLAQAHGPGAGQHGFAVLVKFFAVQMGVAVHATQGQGQSQGIHSGYGFFGHGYLATDFFTNSMAARQASRFQILRE